MALYENAVALANHYIGPAGQRFIDRQITTHLNIKTAELNTSHLPELSKWCYSSGKLVIDEKLAGEFRDAVVALK